MSEDVKKRNRLTLVCSYCKKRKVKCDKGRPCSACIKHNVGHLCSYTENPWIDSVGAKHDGETVGNVPRFIVKNNTTETPPVNYGQYEHQQQVERPLNSSLPPEYHGQTPPLHRGAYPTQPTQALAPYSLQQPPQSVQAPVGYQTVTGVTSQYPQVNLNSNVKASEKTYLPQYTSATPAAEPIIQAQPMVVQEGVVQSELDALKDKIRQIEASITVANLAQPNTSVASQHLTTPGSPKAKSQVNSMQQNYSNQLKPLHQAVAPQTQAQYFQQQLGDTKRTISTPSSAFDHTSPLPANNVEKGTRSNSIQLPPLMWSNPHLRASVFEKDRVNNSNGSGGRKVTDSLAGMNPVESDADHFNLYEGYTPIHIRDSTRRTNYGPFSWLSIMRKDPALLILWQCLANPTKEAKEKSLMQKSGVYPHVIDDKKVQPSNGSKGVEHQTDFTGNSEHPSSKSRTMGCITIIDIENHEENSHPIKKRFKYADSDDRFREMALDRDGYNDIRPYQDLKRQSSSNQEEDGKSNSSVAGTEIHGSKANRNAPPGGDTVNRSTLAPDKSIQKMNENTISLGLTLFDRKIDQELKLIEKIQVMLPEKRIIWILIHKYFAVVYPFLPIIDEFNFVKEMSRILGPEEKKEDYSNKECDKFELQVEKRLDFANLGILLIMLRITYLSLFTNRSSLNEQNLNSTDTSAKATELKLLLTNPISMDIVYLAQLCLDQFSLMQQSNLEVLKCSLFMRFYHKFAPEEGDGLDGGDSQISTGMLVRMAYSLGINREPDNYPEILQNPRENNITRKLWGSLVISDLILSISYGSPLNTDPKHSDIKAPYHVPGNENISNTDIEKFVISTFDNVANFYNYARELLDICLSIKGKINLQYLTSKISEFEVYCVQTFGDIESYLVPFDEKVYSYPFSKCQKCKCAIMMRILVISLLFHIYLYYEKKNNIDLTFFYMKKLLQISLCELLPTYSRLVWNMHRDFGDASMLFLNPTIEEIMHKSNHLNFVVIIRLNATIYRMKKDPLHQKRCLEDMNYALKYSKLCKLSAKLEKSIAMCVSTMSRLTSRYYYAWRVVKSNTYFLNKVYEENAMKVFENVPEVRFPDVSVDQIDELIELADVPLRTRSKKDERGEADQQKNEENTNNYEADKTNNIDKDTGPPKLTHSVLGLEGSKHPNHLLSTKGGTDLGTSASEQEEVFDNDTIDKLWYNLASKKVQNDSDNHNNGHYPNVQGKNNNYNAQNVQGAYHEANNFKSNGVALENSNLRGEYNRIDANNNPSFGPLINTPFPEEDPISYLREFDLLPFDMDDFSRIYRLD
ncbi:multidrug resistance regulator 1 [[Candida] railenensis]|uniref:Multidrug resistance regulator 1 n=1 Tax=[Candida] railenensis TaxID=45579 RepID=A0A9P0QR79_9ASCO|nr:multidrug resistance regulator 1 [[Candida] railenensis]